MSARGIVCPTRSAPCPQPRWWHLRHIAVNRSPPWCSRLSFGHLQRGRSDTDGGSCRKRTNPSPINSWKVPHQSKKTYHGLMSLPKMGPWLPVVCWKAGAIWHKRTSSCTMFSADKLSSVYLSCSPSIFFLILKALSKRGTTSSYLPCVNVRWWKRRCQVKMVRNRGYALMRQYHLKETVLPSCVLETSHTTIYPSTDRNL